MKTLTKEHRKNLSLSKMGDKNPMYGKKQSPEFIAKRLAGRGDHKSEKHWNWKGEEVSYSGVHKWLYRHLGKASVCLLADPTCSSKFEWSNISGEYKRDFEDWRQLCASHHRRVDGNGANQLHIGGRFA